MAKARRCVQFIVLAAMILLAGGVSLAQRIAIIAPNRTPLDENVAAHLKAGFSAAFRIQDLEMSRAAFDASGRSDRAFNMSQDDAHDLAGLLGCDFLILIKSGTQRRADLDRPDYFESFISFYVVSGRTGRLIKWALVSEKGESEQDAEHRVVQSSMDPDLIGPIRNAWQNEPLEAAPPRLEDVPNEGTREAKGFRPPVPYRKLKPEYTRTAFLYDVTATVEATVDLDECGQITRVEISKWAGYGLDESVVTAIQAMNWRPAERGGKPLPIRFLLRYNFKKIDKDD